MNSSTDLAESRGTEPVTPVNSGGFRIKETAGVLQPETVGEVVQLMRELSAPGTGDVHIHVISSGKNWGFGSAEPAADGAIVLDLHRLDAIREMDGTVGVCVIEPGVTQGRLAQELIGSGYLLNVTASSSATSVIGNVLERGIGLRRQRSDDVIGLEVVLADGTLARVGRWPREGTATTPYDHLPGPNALQLFAQSNLGVVTAAVVRLLPVPESLKVVRLQFGREQFTSAIDYLRDCWANGMAGGVIKIFDTAATRAYGGEVPPGYQAYLPVSGRARLVDQVIDLITEETSSGPVFSGCRVLDPDEPIDSVAERAAVRGYVGDPGANDDMARAIFGVPMDEVDANSGEGWLFCVPVVPFTAAALTAVTNLLPPARDGKTDLTVGHTLNVLPSGWVDVVVSIRFPRTAAAIGTAHALLDRLHQDFRAAGFPPYRLDVDHMTTAEALRADPGQEVLLGRLKAALDPQNIIARGRYESPGRPPAS